MLVALAEFADTTGLAWPSQATIAKQTSMSVRTVRRAMQELERLGFISRRARGRPDGRGRTSDMIQLDLHRDLAANLSNLAANLTEDKSGNHHKIPSRKEGTTFQEGGYAHASTRPGAREGAPASPPRLRLVV